MDVVLYRKYRPKKLSEIVGQTVIVETLEAALKKKAVGHALLFTGSRGVGKTSLARILAHEINGITCDTTRSAPLDIIEIDAASSGRIDEVRDLRDKLALMPLELPYKVYIIDEVHMLTKEAFNALLKTLEEPPPHIIFILATTEVHKVPATIISRCQRFAFKSISSKDLTNHLEKIAKLEKMNLVKGAASLLAEHAHGSLRDALGLLEQIGSLKQEITTELVESTLGLPPHQLLENLAQALLDQNPTKTIQLYQEFLSQGTDLVRLTGSLHQMLRDNVLQEKDYAKRQRILDILKDLLDVFKSPQPQIILEVTLIKHSQAEVESKAK